MEGLVFWKEIPVSFLCHIFTSWYLYSAFLSPFPAVSYWMSNHFSGLFLSRWVVSSLWLDSTCLTLAPVKSWPQDSWLGGGVGTEYKLRLIALSFMHFLDWCLLWDFSQQTLMYTFSIWSLVTVTPRPMAPLLLELALTRKSLLVIVAALDICTQSAFPSMRMTSWYSGGADSGRVVVWSFPFLKIWI